MTSMFKAQRSTLLLAAAGAAVGAIVMRTMPRTGRPVDAGHPDRSLSDGLGDEGSTLGLPKSHRPPGLFLRSAYVFMCGGVLAVGIRVFYGMVSNVSDGPDWHPAVRTIWHSEHRIGAGAIMALAGVYLGLAAALFLATAFRASDPSCSSRDRGPHDRNTAVCVGGGSRWLDLLLGDHAGCRGEQYASCDGRALFLHRRSQRGHGCDQRPHGDRA